MKFFIFVFCCNIIYPFIMIICGGLLWKHYPKKPNSIIGYRTSRSMKNDETWAFAQVDCGKRMFKVGIILLLPFVLCQLPFINVDKKILTALELVFLVVGLTVIIVTAFITEKRLKQSFTDEGQRK